MRFPSTLLLVSLVGLAAPAQAQQLSVRPTLFFGGDEVTHGDFTAMGNLAIEGESAELSSGITLEALLSLNLLQGGTGPLSVVDNSSYLRLRWRPAGWAESEGIAFTVLPLHANRLYLGYEFPMTEGLAQLAPQGPQSGAKLSLVRGRGMAFAAVKSALVFNPLAQELQRRYTAFAGGGFELLAHLTLEAEGSYADQAVNPEPAQLGTPLRTWAWAARVRYHRGSEIGPPTDFDRYREDPSVWENLLRPETYDGQLSYAIAGEALYLSRSGLSSGDSIGEVAPAQSSTGLALQGRLKANRTRVFFRAQRRSLSLLLADGPGFPPFFALPGGLQTESELSASASVDHHFERTHLTPGAQLALIRPASFRVAGSPLLPGSVVVLDAHDLEVPPGGEDPSSIYEAKLTLRWDLKPISVLAEARYAHDGNRTHFDNGALGPTLVAENPSTYGFNALIQARF